MAAFVYDAARARLNEMVMSCYDGLMRIHLITSTKPILNLAGVGSDDYHPLHPAEHYSDAEGMLADVVDDSADYIAELQLLSFDDEEVAARLEMVGLPVSATDEVKAAAARALAELDDPVPAEEYPK